jgi:GrpB-like predicted nucleotidyltransferase (UPF0157 family)
METIEAQVRRLVAEAIAVVDYDPRWPASFAAERDRLRACLPGELLGRIEHFGSTAVPGLAAKPIIDLLIEVSSLAETKRRIVPLLVGQGYEYLWRPSWGNDVPPFYAWFIRRDQTGQRTHHLHMIEKDFAHWDRLGFRDYLINHPDQAAEYGALKRRLAAEHPHDRVAYTEGKGSFIAGIMAVVEREQRLIRMLPG